VFFDDPEFDRSAGNLFNELFFRPTPWLSFFADTQLPVVGDEAKLHRGELRGDLPPGRDLEHHARPPVYHRPSVL